MRYVCHQSEKEKAVFSLSASVENVSEKKKGLVLSAVKATSDTVSMYRQRLIAINERKTGNR